MNFTIHARLLQSEPVRRCRLEECCAACCLYGVWLDAAEWEHIQAHAGLVAEHMPAHLRDPALWVDGQTDLDAFSRSGRVIHSRVLPDARHYGGSACVFLREDHKCALQVAGQAAEYHPWRFKPFYCILHPLDLDEGGRITLDTTENLLAEAGSCLRPQPEPQPLVKVFEPELRYLLGDQRYAELCRQINAG